MYETYKIQNKCNQFTDTGLTCTLNNGQSITIPKSIRETVPLMPGDEVTVGLTNSLQELIIRKYNRASLDNKMIISERGGIWIPKELRKSLCLRKGDMFQVYVSNSTQLIKLTKVI
ncbi:AbrB/MazE/SpoVT family DNA-binding domain-containing protein [Virgibacillus oceani]|uniref:SpoVT-AbrB domain-containing protein n=1 Tax=Virgibacillus oceani TaxID=1479511 RepID=A0A917GYC8_9BACI|nr:AbrB/MazE/SpoVT family DNA-binding domain-containing protein [Virgibacillus oceani]GGG61172.1 hypothetical protein GCM10011398_00560 [Virgibacillus oceani]